MSMGANIVLCDPHRVVVTGPHTLYPSHMSSPDVRAGMSMIMAACVANGRSVIENVYQVRKRLSQHSTKTRITWGIYPKSRGLSRSAIMA